MPWSYARSRLSLRLKRLRSRFGITAPQVAIRTHLPWPLRVLSIILITIAAVAFAGWAYRFGAKMAGFDQSETGQLVSKLQEANQALEEETARLRSLLTSAQSTLQIEQAAQKQLAEKQKLLVEENTRLKEELAVFERFARPDTAGRAVGQEGNEIALERITVKPDGPGRYRYGFNLTLQQGPKRAKEARLNLQLLVSPRDGNAGGDILLPGDNAADAKRYEIVVRNFLRVDGRFEIPREFVVGSVELRIYEAGKLKASKNISL